MAKLHRLVRNGSLKLEAAAGGDEALLEPEAWRQNAGAGLLLPVDAEPEPEFAQASLIAIDFPAFNDGRGLSLAVLLRSRIGYAGELRAVGDIHPELLHYMIRCGFDSFMLPPERQALLTDDARVGGFLAPYSNYYQASVVEPTPAYRRTRRGA